MSVLMPAEHALSGLVILANCVSGLKRSRFVRNMQISPIMAAIPASHNVFSWNANEFRKT